MQQVCSSSLRVTTAARKLRQLSTFRCYSIGSFVVCNATTHRCVRNHPEYSPYQKRLASNATSTTVASSTATPDAASSSTDFASSLQEKWAADAATLLDEGVADLAGETLTDVGLGGYSPVGLMESLLDGIHSFTGLPWWMTIVLTAIGLRTAMIPLTVYGRKKARKLREINPEVEEAKDMKRLYKRAKSRARVQMEVQKLSTIYKKAGVKPISALLPYLGQLGLVFVGFRAIKNLAHAPILSMFTEGTLIFPDLTAPSIPLTLINCAAMVAAFRMGDGGVSSPSIVRMRWFVMMSSVLALPFLASAPSGFWVFWITSSSFSVVHSGVMMAADHVRGYPHFTVPQLNPLDVFKQTFEGHGADRVVKAKTKAVKKAMDRYRSQMKDKKPKLYRKNPLKV